MLVLSDHGKNNLKGALLMMGSMAGFVINDTFIKLVSTDVPLFQTLFIRGIVASFILGWIARNRGTLRPVLNNSDLKYLVLRGIGEVGSTLCFLTALYNMRLANATAILQSMPLAVTLAAAVFLGHSVGWRRYLAIAIGFSGVLIIVRPGYEGFNNYSLLAVLAVVFLVIRDLSTRTLSESMPSSFVALYAAVLIMSVGGILSFFKGWENVSFQNIFILMLSACFIVIGYLCAVMAMRVGDIAFVSPFRYSVLVWAIILGYLVFGDIPDALMLMGATIVCAMGIFTFYRERKL